MVLLKEFTWRKLKLQETKDQRPMTTKNQPLLWSAKGKQLQQAKTEIIQSVQEKSFSKELALEHYIDASPAKNNHKETCERKDVLKISSLYRLDPFGDGDGILRIGGRLHAKLEHKGKHPRYLRTTTLLT